jgi:hypothetical protein
MVNRGEFVMSIKKLTCASWIGLASVFTLVAQAASENIMVPAQWNMPTWTDGAAFQTFDGEELPTWANTQGTATSPARTEPFPFWNDVPVGNALKFSTETGITATLGDAKIQPGVPLFIYMRCKMNPFASAPDIDVATKLCFYMNAENHLVVAKFGQIKTTTVDVESAVYYPIMIRFASDTFDVFFNGSTEVAASLANVATTQLSRMVISGDGEMDDLYVSYGDPTRYSATAEVALDGWTPTLAEEIVAANWVANQKAKGGASVTHISKANAENYYLTGTTPSNADFAGELGIGSFSYDPSTHNVTVIVTLTAGAGTAVKKDSTTHGKINGILKLKGATDYDKAKAGGTSWETIAGAINIEANDFAGGVATYTFNLPDDTYKFFLPIIVSDVK